MVLGNTPACALLTLHAVVFTSAKDILRLVLKPADTMRWFRFVRWNLMNILQCCFITFLHGAKQAQCSLVQTLTQRDLLASTKTLHESNLQTLIQVQLYYCSYLTYVVLY